MGETIYCLSGLGADERIFSGLHINNCQLKYIPWIEPLPKENLQAYSLRMSNSINDEYPILLGVSFGGMIAIEMAKQLNVQMVILVSSVKRAQELPQWMKLAGRLQLNKFLPVKSNRLTERFDDLQLGISNEDEKILVDSYRKSSDPSYMNWAINEVLNWKNEWQPRKLYHIHGSMDRMFPIRRIQATHIIEGGTHIMMLNKSEEISKHISNIVEICKRQD